MKRVLVVLDYLAMTIGFLAMIAIFIALFCRFIADLFHEIEGMLRGVAAMCATGDRYFVFAALLSWVWCAIRWKKISN